MKLITGLCLIGVVYATNYGYSAEYMKISVHNTQANDGNAVANVTTATAENCSTSVLSEFLVKIPAGTYADTAAIAKNGGHLLSSGQLNGACLTVDATNALPKFGTGEAANDKGFLIVKTGASNYFAAQTAGAGCTGVITVMTTGFELVNSQDCGGVTTTDDGIATVGTKGFPMKGTLFTGRHLALQMIGPFSDSACTALNGDKFDSYPIIVPTETKTVQSVTVSAIDTSNHCQEYGFTTDAASREAWAYKLGANAGELVFTMNSNGTGMAYSDTNMVCTLKPDGAIFHQLTYTFAANGSYSHCLESQDDNGSDAAKYFRLAFAPSSIGLNPNPTAATATPGSPGSPAACNPAMGLQVSATMAVMIALVGMLL